MNICDDCGYEFEVPLYGIIEGLLLNGCPECGCGQYTEKSVDVALATRAHTKGAGTTACARPNGIIKDSANHLSNI